MMTKKAWIIGTALLALPAACSESSVGGADVMLSSRVLGRYGSVDGPLVLREIGSITLTQGSADTLLVTQFRVPSILVLTADGDSIRSIGRAGAGPGEFTAPFQPRILRDTLWIADLNGAIKRFMLDGRFLDELRLLMDPLGPFQSAPRFVTVLRDGNLLYRGIPSTGGNPPESISSVPWVRTDRTGEVIDTVIRQTLRYSGFRLSWNPSGAFVLGIHPADNSDRIAVDPTNRWIVAAVPSAPEDGRIPVRVAWHSFDAVETTAQTVHVSAISSASALDAWIGKLAATEDRPLGEVDRAVREQVPWPDHLPAVQNLMIDNNGRAWLATPHASQDSIRWLAIDRENGPLGSLVLHNSIRLHAARGQTLWASVPGALDEPYIVKLVVNF